MSVLTCPDTPGSLNGKSAVPAQGEVRPRTVAEVARETGTPERTVRHWLKTGQLRGRLEPQPRGKGLRWVIDDAPESEDDET